MGRLEGKVALITGGASGIGEATVRLFAEEGASVLVADILDARGQSIASELGDRVAYVHADVSVEADVKSAIGQAVGRFGQLDCLFNNAGFARAPVYIQDIALEAWNRHIAVLLGGVFLGIKHAAPIMIAQQSGSIVNTASVAGFQTGFGPHPYSAAKAAVMQLTRTTAVELGPHGVRVNCVCPGAIPTPIFAKGMGLSQEAAELTVDGLKVAFKERQPIHRAGSPLDIARAVLWLACEESSFVNGQAIVVDGGLTCGHAWSETAAALRAIAPALNGPA